jgi:hypothetical protein
MNLTTVLAFLAPFESLLKPELLKLEAQGKTELDTLISTVSSPDLKLLLQVLSTAIDSFAQAEVEKLP